MLKIIKNLSALLFKIVKMYTRKGKFCFVTVNVITLLLSVQRLKTSSESARSMERRCYKGDINLSITWRKGGCPPPIGFVAKLTYLSSRPCRYPTLIEKQMTRNKEFSGGPRKMSSTPRGSPISQKRGIYFIPQGLM